MDLKLLLQTTAYVLPIFSAIYCIVLLLVNLRLSDHNRFTKRLMLLLVCFYVIEIAYCITIALFFFQKDLFVYVAPLNFYTMLVMPVMLYQVIFKLTRLRTAEDFNLRHYVLPLFFFVIYVVWSFHIPFQFQSSLLFATETYHGDNFKIFTEFYTHFRLYIRLIFSVVYLFLCIYRLIAYRRIIIEYSADIDASSLGWVYNIIFCLTVLFPTPFIYYFASNDSLFEYVVLIVLLFFVVIFNSILCCNIFSKNFLLLTEDIVFSKKDLDIVDSEKNIVIDPGIFEEYMSSEKPYLRPDLRITDMVGPLGTNRTYLSNFINSYYGQNFSSFINSYRLKEMEALRSDPYYKDFEEEELVYTAGFKSIKSYQRTREADVSQGSL